MEKIDKLKNKIESKNEKLNNLISENDKDKKELKSILLILGGYITLIISLIVAIFICVIGPASVLYYYIIYLVFQVYNAIFKNKYDYSISNIKSLFESIDDYNEKIEVTKSEINKLQLEIEDIIRIEEEKQRVADNDQILQSLKKCVKKCENLNIKDRLEFLKKIENISKDYSDRCEKLIIQNNQNGINLSVETYSRMVNDIFREIFKLDNEIDKKINETRELLALNERISYFNDYLSEQMNSNEEGVSLVKKI